LRDAARRRASRVLGFATAALAVLAAAAPASARTERIRWRYPAPDRVEGFKIHIGQVSGAYGKVVDVGKPARNGNVYEADVEVPDLAVMFVAVSAYAGTAESELSNQVTHEPKRGGGGGKPPKEDRDDALVERFGSYEVGEDPAGWIDTGPAAVRGSDDSLFAVTRRRRNAMLTTESTLADIHSHYLTEHSPTWTHYEFRGRMRIDDPDGGVGVTVLSQFPGRDAYYRIRRSAGAANGEFAMAPHPEGYAISCTSSETGIEPRDARWYRFRVQVAADDGETIVRAKVWRGMHPQPKDWQIECVDDSPTRLTQGAPGVWSAGPGAKHWDDLRVIPLEPGVVETAGSRRMKSGEATGKAPGKPVLIQD
jgi:hypothetical protein